MLTIQQIEDAVTYHKPTAEAIECHTEVRECIKTALHIINNTLPDCREKSLAITKIEEAMFWANAGIARNHDKL